MLNEREYVKLVNFLKKKQAFTYEAHELKMRATDKQLVSAHKEAGIEQGLTARDIDIQDSTDGAIHHMLECLVGKELAWDISLIGDLRDVIIERLARETGQTEYSFHPYIILPKEERKNTFQDIYATLQKEFHNDPSGVLEEFESLLDIYATSDDYKTEDEAIHHLIEATYEVLDKWWTLLRACGERV